MEDSDFSEGWLNFSGLVSILQEKCHPLNGYNEKKIMRSLRSKLFCPPIPNRKFLLKRMLTVRNAETCKDYIVSAQGEYLRLFFWVR